MVVWVVSFMGSEIKVFALNLQTGCSRGNLQIVCLTSTWVSPPTQSLCTYDWDNANSGEFILTFQPISKNSYSTNFVHFIHHQFVHFIYPEKPVRGLMNNFVHFIHPYMNPSPIIKGTLMQIWKSPYMFVFK